MNSFKQHKSKITTRKTISNFDCLIQLRSILVAIFLAGVIVGSNACANKNVSIRGDSVKICFSPEEDCTGLITTTIGAARNTIFVQAYIFTAHPIAEALIKAHQRGVKVAILVDRSQKNNKNTQIYKMLDHGIAVSIDNITGIAHNKIMIIDDRYVITGSFNWSNAAAYRNAENLLVIDNKELNKIYRSKFEQRASAATPLCRKIVTAG